MVVQSPKPSHVNNFFNFGDEEKCLQPVVQFLGSHYTVDRTREYERFEGYLW